jgi:hypothetical protein
MMMIEGRDDGWKGRGEKQNPGWAVRREVGR